MKRMTVIYDIETTGLSYVKDRIIQLAGYHVQKKECFNEYINPKMHINSKAAEIHKITEDFLKDKPDADTVLGKFLDFCGENCYLVAHNNDSFDKLFLVSELKRNGYEVPKFRYIDTLKLARLRYPGLESHKLDILRNLCNLSTENSHDALKDTQDLYHVYCNLRSNSTDEEIYQELKNNTLTKIPFGKFKGKEIKDVPIPYVQWLRSTGFFENIQNLELKKAFKNNGFEV